MPGSSCTESSLLGSVLKATESSKGASAAAHSTPSLPKKSCLVTLLGTGNKFDGRTDDKKVRIETLSAIHIASSGNTNTENAANETSRLATRIFDGPGTLGSNVYEIIAEASIYIFDQIAIHGVDNIHIHGHSRGAVESIFVANILQKIKDRLNDNANPILLSEDLFSTCSTSVRALLIQKYEEKYKAQTQNPLDNIQNLKDRVNAARLNIFAIDPVPGDDYFNYLPKDFIAWRDPEIFTIPSIVQNYYQILFEHERSQCFNALCPVAAEGNTTSRLTIEHCWGNHCNGSGILTIQDPTYESVTVDSRQKQLVPAIQIGDQRYDTSGVQDLVLCKMLQFMQTHTGFTQFDTTKIDEKVDYHDSWLGLNLQPLKTVFERFIQAKPDACDQQLLEIYKKIHEAKPAFDYLAQYTYGTRGRAFFSTNHTVPRYVLMRKKETVETILLGECVPDFIPIDGYTNLQHLLLEMHTEINADTQLKSILDGILINGQINTQIDHLCAGTQSLVNILLAHRGSSAYPDNEKIKAFKLNLLKTVVGTITNILITPGISSDVRDKIIALFSRINEQLTKNTGHQDIQLALKIYIKEIIDAKIKDYIEISEFYTASQQHAGEENNRAIILTLLKYRLLLDEINHLHNILIQLSFQNLHQQDVGFIRLTSDSSAQDAQEATLLELFKITDGIGKVSLAKRKIEVKLLEFFNIHSHTIFQTLDSGLSPELTAASIPASTSSAAAVTTHAEEDTTSHAEPAVATPSQPTTPTKAISPSLSALETFDNNRLTKHLPQTIEIVHALAILHGDDIAEKFQQKDNERKENTKNQIAAATAAQTAAETTAREATAQSREAETRASAAEALTAAATAAKTAAENALREVTAQSREAETRASAAEEQTAAATAAKTAAENAAREALKEQKIASAKALLDRINSELFINQINIDNDPDTIVKQAYKIDETYQSNLILQQIGIAGTITFGIIGTLAIGGVAISFILIPGLNIFTIIGLGIAAIAIPLAGASGIVATIGYARNKDLINGDYKITADDNVEANAEINLMDMNIHP